MCMHKKIKKCTSLLLLKVYHKNYVFIFFMLIAVKLYSLSIPGVQKIVLMRVNVKFVVHTSNLIGVPPPADTQKHELFFHYLLCFTKRLFPP